jgi:hypothetical protein
MIRLKFTFKVEYEITPGDAAYGSEPPKPGPAHGFTPAFLDFQTFTLYSSRFAQGALAAGTRLVPGYERSGYFYTRRAAARAAREWIGAG